MKGDTKIAGISMSRKAIAVISIILGLAIIASPGLLTWIVALYLIVSGILWFVNK